MTILHAPFFSGDYKREIPHCKRNRIAPRGETPDVSGELAQGSEEVTCPSCRRGKGLAKKTETIIRDYIATHYQPRYVAYAAAHARTPEAMLAYDAERYPGGRMAGFIVWISERWQEWDKLHACKPNPVRFTEEHAAFDAWLTAQYVP